MARKIIVSGCGLWVCLVLTSCASKVSELKAQALQNTGVVIAKQLSFCEEIHFVEYNEYTDDFEAMGCKEELLTSFGGKPYTIYLGPDSFLDLSDTHYRLPPGVEPAVEPYSYRAVIVGNIDADSRPDVWTIEEMQKPVNIINDLEN